jgi:hypothetical protein
MEALLKSLELLLEKEKGWSPVRQDFGLFEMGELKSWRWK